jgi:transposase
MSKAQAARTFSVSLSSVKRYVNKANHGGSLAPKKRPGSTPKLDETASRLLAADLEEPSLPHPSTALRLHRGHDWTLGESLHHVPRHSSHRLYAQKGGRVATERDEFLRAAWRG